MKEHLNTCQYCRGRLNAYRRFIELFRTGAESPQPVDSTILFRRNRFRRTRLIAAAAILGVFVIVPLSIVSVQRYSETALRKEYAADISRKVIQGSLFSGLNGYAPVYEGTWFESDTAFDFSRGKE